MKTNFLLYYSVLSAISEMKRNCAPVPMICKSFRVQNEILDRKHLEKTIACFSPNTVKTTKRKKTKNGAGECFFSVPPRNWKTNTSNKHNS